jgi:hypothetical protein
MAIGLKVKNQAVLSNLEVSAITNNIASGTATIGTAATNVAHGLGRVPVMISVLPIGTTAGTIVQSAVADGTNLKLIATVAGAVSWSAL